MEPLTVKTPRLTICTNDLDGMQALWDGCTDPEMQDAYRDMMEVMRRCPDQQEWGCEWNIFLTETGAVIGGICFKGTADTQGRVELGYGIEEPYRCQGYAAETVRAMAAWALSQPEVQCVLAQTKPHNAISQRVLAKCGFVRCGNGEEGPLFSLTQVPACSY